MRTVSIEECKNRIATIKPVYPRYKRGEKLNSKLTDEQVSEIRSRFVSGESIDELSVVFKMSKLGIRYIVDDSYRECMRKYCLKRYHKNKHNIKFMEQRRKSDIKKIKRKLKQSMGYYNYVKDMAMLRRIHSKIK